MIFSRVACDAIPPATHPPMPFVTRSSPRGLLAIVVALFVAPWTFVAVVAAALYLSSLAGWPTSHNTSSQTAAAVWGVVVLVGSVAAIALSLYLFRRIVRRIQHPDDTRTARRITRDDI